MSEFRKRILWTFGLAPFNIVIVYVGRQVLRYWGILDPFAAWLGGWLKVHVTPPQAEWTIAATISAVGYGAALYFIWRHFHRPLVATGEGAKVGQSIKEVLEAPIAAHNAPKNPDGAFDWKGLLEAVNAFCDPELVWRRNKYIQTIENSTERSHEIEREMQTLYDAAPGGGFRNRPDEEKKYNELRERLERFATLKSFSETGLRDYWELLRGDLGQKLVSGDLIAKGYAEPYKGGSDEVLIKASEWRMLTVSPYDGTAMKKIGLPSIVYSGVEIARPIPPALEIIFDRANPARKFWSLEQSKDENGKPVPHLHWEYRASIKNKSSKTLRNVKVTVEAIGDMPRRAEPSYFDINKKPLVDLNPGEDTLAVIRRWFNPPIVVGMVCGGAYGPIKMTASADDVPMVAKLFWFEPEATPMILEIKFE